MIESSSVEQLMYFQRSPEFIYTGMVSNWIQIIKERSYLIKRRIKKIGGKRWIQVEENPEKWREEVDPSEGSRKGWEEVDLKVLNTNLYNFTIALPTELPRPRHPS